MRTGSATMVLLILAMLPGFSVAGDTTGSRRAVVPITPSPIPSPAGAGQLDLQELWELALVNNPLLRESAAEVDAARGQALQASRYPNPRFIYEQQTIGNNQASAGTISLLLNQELVTAGKRRLDVAIAGRGTDAAVVALLGRQFEVLTRIRRLHHEFLGWLYTIKVTDDVLASLRQGIEVTRKLVEDAGSRPRSDLLRLQALLRETEINQRRNSINLEATWRQLAAEVGVPSLPMPAIGPDLPTSPRGWTADDVLRRVLAVNTQLRLAAIEVERAHLEVERARAEAIPNVTVGGGYNHEAVDRVSGAIVSVETALPVWDRKQGHIREAEARLARALAGEQATAQRLSQQVAVTFAAFQAARQQVEQLTSEVLPPLTQSLEQLRKSYQAGAAQVTFADVLSAQQSLDDVRIRIAESRRALWQAVADLHGLMQFELSEEQCPGR